MASVRPQDNEYNLSIFSLNNNFPSFQSNPWGWESAWDKLFKTLSPVEDVYPTTSPMLRQLTLSELTDETRRLEGHICAMQEMLVQVWTGVEKNGFRQAWLLLDEKERKRHLLKGMEDACENSLYRYDARAFCPEITVRSMLKRRGMAFIDFLAIYSKGKTDVGTGNMYALPSEWWQQILNVSDPIIETSFPFLTVQRNEFITLFLLRAMMSIIHDVVHGSSGMDRVLDNMEQGGLFVNAFTEFVAGMPDKPIIRCQNCTKSQEEIGGGVKFMLCSVCKSKLNFPVHYCSQVCQKEDWRKHKKACGKEKVAKKLPGTAQDPLWAQVPEHISAGLSSAAAETGSVHITNFGFGAPHPSRPHSPALQRQLSLINGDRYADYFLFDDLDRPIRFAIGLEDEWTKLVFRFLRSSVMFSPDGGDFRYIGALAEYMIKRMDKRPGLSRAGILAQLNKEYGCDTAAMLVEFQTQGRVNGYVRGVTFVETMAKGMVAIPEMMERLRL